MIALTAASGQLGRLTLDILLSKIPATQLAAIVRTPAKVTDFAARGVTVRQADYNDVAALAQAFTGVERLLLISSSEIGQRATQHRNVITAARQAGVRLLVYTSLLQADRSSLSLAAEHVATEDALKASGLPFVILRNGWYTENYTASIASALAHGAFIGSAGQGRIASAARADYAEAAAAVLTGTPKIGHSYELAGDTPYTLADLAAEISHQTGKPIPYRDLPPAEYEAILLKAGLPAALAAAIPDWDAQAAKGALDHDGHELAELIGRPTTPLRVSVQAALRN